MYMRTRARTENGSESEWGWALGMQPGLALAEARLRIAPFSSPFVVLFGLFIVFFLLFFGVS
jgi:hypothetical protein